MQTFREALLSLVVLIVVAVTVLGGIFLAIGETSATLPPLIIPLADTVTPKPSPSSNADAATATPFALITPTPTFTLTPTLAATAAIATLTSTAAAPTTAPPTLRSAPTSTSTPCAVQSGWVTYTVQSGETMFRIAQRYGLSAAQLQQGNCLTSPNLFSGQKIFVPAVLLTPEATDTRPAPTATASPLTISSVGLATVELDSTRDNGAIAIIKVVASGGFTPYIYVIDQEIGQPFDHIRYKTQCGATISGTIRVTSADGQAATKPYIFYNLPCPPK
ncbi:MAG: LysM peptidoglycan-binding domain-containing protein [Chloroflexi bacterium]|nr:LysM peptidoglycan-binding domain-containing protein [Chloroflexota bacterium]